MKSGSGVCISTIVKVDGVFVGGTGVRCCEKRKSAKDYLLGVITGNYPYSLLRLNKMDMRPFHMVHWRDMTLWYKYFNGSFFKFCSQMTMQQVTQPRSINMNFMPHGQSNHKMEILIFLESSPPVALLNMTYLFVLNIWLQLQVGGLMGLCSSGWCSI